VRVIRVEDLTQRVIGEFTPAILARSAARGGYDVFIYVSRFEGFPTSHRVVRERYGGVGRRGDGTPHCRNAPPAASARRRHTLQGRVAPVAGSLPRRVHCHEHGGNRAELDQP
jgi:hypothetical protein